MSILVVAEHSHQELAPCVRHVIEAAKCIGNTIDVLVIGHQCQKAAEQAAKLAGVTSIKLADHAVYEHQLPETVAPLIAEVAKNYTHVLMAATTTGKNTLPRSAALMDVQAISDVIAVIDADTFKRPIYAGNVIATVKSSDDIKCLTIRATAFDATPTIDSDAKISTIDTVVNQSASKFVKEALAESDRPELTAAKIVVSGGRGVKNKENFDLIYQLADKLGAAVGASRAAVDAGYVPNDMQVGQTGKIVAPELYIAIGISGAIQHLAGMKDSKVIVAINNDEDAPIFQVADYGLVSDLFEAVPELTGKL